MMGKFKIEEDEFISIAQIEDCRSCLSERTDAILPAYYKYQIQAKDLLNSDTYPIWRTSKCMKTYIGDYKISPTEAYLITYYRIALCQWLFDDIKFYLENNYFDTNNIIIFHCSSCNVRIVKDGNHRLLQYALYRNDVLLTVYEVSSADWTRSKVDMKNFCKCINNNLNIYY